MRLLAYNQITSTDLAAAIYWASFINGSNWCTAKGQRPSLNIINPCCRSV